jgi:hypothetical protein
MISYVTFNLWDRKQVKGALLADFLLYSLAFTLQGFPGMIFNFGLFWMIGWIWNSRQRLPNGARALPGPWGELPWIQLTRWLMNFI